MDQRAAEPHLLFHAARELARGTTRKRTESRRVEQFFDAGRTLRSGKSEELAMKSTLS